MAPVLEVRDLCKTFTLHTIDGRTVVSLRGVNLDVAAGEHVAIAGPNGAGKSSLLRCVHRTYLPDSGSITLHLAGGPVSLAVASGLFGSAGEARRAIAQGGLTIGGERVAALDTPVPKPVDGEWLVVRAGKRRLAVGRRRR